MLHFIRLIRLPNLLIVALTQGIIYFHLILPNFRVYDIQPALPMQEFLLFVAVTILITAGGYIINDILDYDTDVVNREKSIVIHKRISIQTATWLYLSSSALGFFLAIYLAFFIGKLELVTLYPIAVGSLYLYSRYLKKMPFIGNLLIALFASGVAGIIGFAESEGIDRLMEEAPLLTGKILVIFWAYLLFAFYSTLYREIIKDIEDIKGDVTQKFRTLPILLGVTKVKRLTMVFGISLLIMIFAGSWLAWPVINFFGKAILLPVLIASGIWSVVSLYNAQKKSDFHKVSQLTKLLMLAGVLLLLTIKLT